MTEREFVSTQIDFKTLLLKKCVENCLKKINDLQKLLFKMWLQKCSQNLGKKILLQFFPKNKLFKKNTFQNTLLFKKCCTDCFKKF